MSISYASLLRKQNFKLNSYEFIVKQTKTDNQISSKNYKISGVQFTVSHSNSPTTRWSLETDAYSTWRTNATGAGTRARTILAGILLSTKFAIARPTRRHLPVPASWAPMITALWAKLSRSSGKTRLSPNKIRAQPAQQRCPGLKDSMSSGAKATESLFLTWLAG